jgi:molybdate/tungstate transport system ATP-binding protein
MLELDALETEYDGFAFGPVTLAVDDEVVTVLGPSGSGKTTLLSLVAGIHSPDRGTIRLDGRDLVGRPLEQRRVGLVFQDGALFPHMTARENVGYATDDDDRVERLAATLEITDVLDRRPAALSGGERQRVALARTLAADPDALLLDEPLSSLDAPVRRRLRDALHDLFADLAVPVVYVTHDQRAATALGDRVAVVRDGHLEQVGTPGDVLSRPASRFVATFTGGDNVVETTVTGLDGDCLVLAVDDLTLRARAKAKGRGEEREWEGPSVCSTVTVCVRPARLRLAGPSESVDADATVVSGTVRRFANEGTEYRVVVDVDGTDHEFAASVPPTEFERLSVTPGDAVRVCVSPDHVHVIG